MTGEVKQYTISQVPNVDTKFSNYSLASNSMLAAIKALLKQPYWVIALILGTALVVFPCVTIDKDHHWNPHQPSTLWPVVVGLLLLLLSSVGFAFTLLPKRATTTDGIGAGLD